MAVFSSIVIPLLTLIVAILALILDYYEYIEESKKSQHEENPGKYINNKRYHIHEVRGEPPDCETYDAGKDGKKIQETDTQE